MTSQAGRIALITGASRGIGRACALGLAKAGAQVIACARSKAGLEELDDEIFAATGQHATLIPFDITDGDAFTVVVTYAGKPEILNDPNLGKSGWFNTSDGATVVGEPE